MEWARYLIEIHTLFLSFISESCAEVSEHRSASIVPGADADMIQLQVEAELLPPRYRFNVRKLGRFLRFVVLAESGARTETWN